MRVSQSFQVAHNQNMNRKWWWTVIEYNVKTVSWRQLRVQCENGVLTPVHQTKKATYQVGLDSQDTLQASVGKHLQGSLGTLQA